MNITANSGIWGTMFGVPCIVADNFLKLATGDQLKVLIYVLRNTGKTCTDEEIARNTGVSVQQAADAVLFWQQANVLNSDEFTPKSIQENVAITPSNEKEQKTQEKIVVTQQPRRSMNPSEISKLMKDSADIAEIFKAAEITFGTLTNAQQNSLIWMYTYLGLKKEVLLTLITYCVNIDRRDMRYIEKIAADWSEKEINTLDMALHETKRLSESREFSSQIMRAFDMKRKPTAKQLNFITQWQSLGYSIGLIHYAYEKTIEQIDKLSFEYINKILQSWSDSGFKTEKDVKNSETTYKKRKKQDAGTSDSDFDVEKYKEFINNF